MYGVVLLAALSAADGSVGFGHKAYPVQPCCHGGGWPSGYGDPKPSDFWPGYSCWGGCGGYASPAYGYPMPPLIRHSGLRSSDVDEGRRRDADRDDRKRDEGGKRKKKRVDDEEEDEVPRMKKPKPKKGAEDEDDKTAALITIFLPPGAKLLVEGRPVTASGVKTFVTPPLEKGSTYYYDATVETQQQGKPVTRTRRVQVTAGESVHADLRDGVGPVAANSELPGK